MNSTLSNNSSKRWYNEHNELHREDGPAVIWRDGTKFWYMNGKLHRLDGPAVEYADGTCYYWINDQKLTEEEWQIHPDCVSLIIRKNIKKII